MSKELDELKEYREYLLELYEQTKQQEVLNKIVENHNKILELKRSEKK